MNLNTPATRGEFEWQGRTFVTTTNGKVYGNGCLYISATPTSTFAKSAKGIKVTVNVEEEVFDVAGSYSREFALAACQSLGYCLPDLTGAFEGLVDALARKSVVVAVAVAPACRQQVFHGVRGATLARLVAQSDDGEVTLWGRVEDEDGIGGHECGSGELSVTDASSIDVSFNAFCDEHGMVLILENVVEDPAIEYYNQDEYLVRCEEWRVVGGLRPIFDEEGYEIVDQVEFSLEEILEGA